MPELNDVQTGETIASQWGNDIRDRTLQRYANAAERTSKHPSPAEGDLSYLADSDSVWVYNGSTWVNIIYLPVNTADIANGAVTGAKLDGGAVASFFAAGGTQSNANVSLTGSFVDQAALTFNMPTGWTTARVIAWGSVGATADNFSGFETRIEIGGQNGTAVSQGFVNIQTQSPRHQVDVGGDVLIAVACRETSGDVIRRWASIQYIVYRLA